MEDKDSIIAHLKEEIRGRDQDIHLAATYGKQLYEEKLQLLSKIDELSAEKELLIQEKHSLQLNLETQIEAVKCQTTDLELQNDLVDDLNTKLQVSEKEKEALCKKIETITKENQYLKKIHSDLDIQNKSLEDKLDLLKKQIKNFEEQAEKSLCETQNDESQELQSQLNTYMLNNKELHEALTASQCELQTIKKNENHLLQMVHELEETINEKNSEIATCHAEIKKAKEEIEELQAEIEVLKYNQVDVKRRGNSVFAELDDRRTMVEKEYKKVINQYEHFRKDYNENKKELVRCKAQMAILQGKVSRSYQEAYIVKLEDYLSTARKEINDLTHKLSKAVKNNVDASAERGYTQRNEYDYLRVMLKQMQLKEKELQNEVVNLTFKNMHDNDKLVEKEQLLFKSKEELDSAKQEILRLKLQIKELESGMMHKLPDEPQVSKPKIEIIDGFKPLTKSQDNEITNKSKSLHDLSIIPGELELFDEGFQQVKPPRKSNKFMLQEFNRIKNEETADLYKPAAKNIELIESNVKETSKTKENSNVTSETDKFEYKPRSRSKINSNKKDGNCAQQ